MGYRAQTRRVVSTCIFRLVIAYRRIDSRLKKLWRQDSRFGYLPTGAALSTPG